MQHATGEQQQWRHAELDARARVMRAAPASAGASAAATAAHASSPVPASSSGQSSSDSSASRSSSAASLAQQQQPRSTRTLLSRLFRSSKSKSGSPRCDGDNDEQGDDARERRRHTNAHSPIHLATGMNALHLRPRHHESHRGDDEQLNSSFYYNHQQQQQQLEQQHANDNEDMRRRESAPAQMKNYHHAHQQHQQQRNGSAYPAAVEHFPTRKILIQGYLTKLSAHKYWHAKPSYFVLEESAVPPGTTLRVMLKQFRKLEDAQQQQTHEELVVSELALSADDVVSDISNRHAKHGFELLFADGATLNQQQAEPATTGSLWSAVAAFTSSSAHNHHDSHHHHQSSVNVVRSLRLAAPDALALESWIGALGNAIAKLIFQSKSQQHQQHYPAATVPKYMIPRPSIVSAKVAPMVADHASDEDEDDNELLKEEIRQAEQQQQLEQLRQHFDEEEKPRRPSGYRALSQSEPEEQPLYSEDGDVAGASRDIELGTQQHTPLRRCPGCYQWMPFDCDDGEQTSCCSGCESDGSSNNNNFHHGERLNSDNQDDDNQSDDTLDRRSLAEFSSPHTSSSATSFTPSDSPNGAFDGSLFDQGSSSSSSDRHHAFSNFIVSPNPPAQIFGHSLSASSLASSSLFSSTVAPYPNKTTSSEHDLESELKSSSTALSRVSSGATAFLRSRFVRGGGTSASPPQYQAYYRPLPPMHSFTANGQVFTLDTRYKLVKSIGTGAYGAVIAVKDASAERSVAVKKITNIFEDLVDAKRILREVRLLHHFQHKNITKLLDLSPPVSKTQFEDMYIITELMETDLHQVIYSMQPMSDDHVKYFLYQMLCALHHIHSAGVIHRDMKPSNVLLNSNCDLKICDFGLARGGVPTHQQSTGSTGSAGSSKSKNREELTEYVVTRWYRAPEIMLNCLQYTEAIDVWAVGCIFAEMLLREPLFPGNDYIHQLKLIIKFLGTPKQEDIEFVKNVKALRFLTKLAIFKPKKWRDVFAGTESDDVNPEAVDLLSKMLIFNPEKRISVDQALQHPYLATFYDPADITSAPEFDFSFDLPDDKLSKEALIDLLCEDVEQFHPSVVRSSAPPPQQATAHSSRFFGMGMTASAS